ncbi:MAG TPA: DUF1761 domain-containing protein [Candidatus Doudnabacteria bacterium]|nr:DUF1761 domain-containing protein [Candidatus Doudnabacteria bacterium]
MDINFVAVLVAAVAQFIFGAIWYMPLFGNLWGKIHGFERNSPEAQEEMKRGMLPLLAIQFIGTVVTTAVFALLYKDMSSEWHTYGFAGFLWLGFIVPTQIAAVLFGGTDPKWILKKILIMIFGSLGCMMILAFVLNFLN